MDYSATFFFLSFIHVLLLCDVHNHNKTVEELFPDMGDQKQVHYRIRLHIRLYGYVFMLIALVALLVKSLLDKYL